MIATASCTCAGAATVIGCVIVVGIAAFFLGLALGHERWR